MLKVHGIDPRAEAHTNAVWGYSPPQVDRIWIWVSYNKIPIYPIFYLLKGGYRV